MSRFLFLLCHALAWNTLSYAGKISDFYEIQNEHIRYE